MASVQSFIRTEVSRGASPAPKGAEAFTAYAIASTKELILEMENAARLTLDHAMTFETLGEGLRLFEGWALRDLVNFRRRCRDNLVTCLDLFLQVQPPGPSGIWIGCPFQQANTLPGWLYQLFTLNQNNLKLQMFTCPLDIRSRIRGEYLNALWSHLNCNVCLWVYAARASEFCADLENSLAQARDKVPYFSQLLITTRFTSRRYAVMVLSFIGLKQVLGIGETL